MLYFSISYTENKNPMFTKKFEKLSAFIRSINDPRMT